MQFSDDILHLLAPELSKLTACTAPEVPESPDYAHALALRQELGPKRYKDPNVVVYLATFVTRLTTSTREYRAGRDHVLRYVDKLPQHSLASHARAVSHFESCVVHTHLAILSLDGLVERLDPNATIAKTDDYDRLRALNNRIKHFDEDVADAAQKKTSPPAAPMWLTNDALVCSKASLQYAELAAILEAQANDAKEFVEGWLT